MQEIFFPCNKKVPSDFQVRPISTCKNYGLLEICVDMSTKVRYLSTLRWTLITFCYNENCALVARNDAYSPSPPPHHCSRPQNEGN
jgi:hypothetical protein